MSNENQIIDSKEASNTAKNSCLFQEPDTDSNLDFIPISAKFHAAGNLAQILEAQVNPEWCFINDGFTLKIAQELLEQIDQEEASEAINTFVAMGGQIQSYGNEPCPICGTAETESETGFCAECNCTLNGAATLQIMGLSVEIKRR